MEGITVTEHLENGIASLNLEDYGNESNVTFILQVDEPVECGDAESSDPAAVNSGSQCACGKPKCDISSFDHDFAIMDYLKDRLRPLQLVPGTPTEERDLKTYFAAVNRILQGRRKNPEAWESFESSRRAVNLIPVGPPALPLPQVPLPEDVVLVDPVPLSIAVASVQRLKPSDLLD